MTFWRRYRRSIALAAALLIAVIAGSGLVTWHAAGAATGPSGSVGTGGTGTSGGGTPPPPVPAYDLVSPTGLVTNLGGAGFYGDATSLSLSAAIVGIAPTPDGKGYWLVGSDGGVFAYGDALFYGSAGAIHLKQPIVGIAPSPDGKGYWLVAADGGIFAYGDARYHGSTGAMHLNAPMVGMSPTPDGKGYWLVAADGGIFAFGDAPFYGSAGAIRLNAPIVGMASASGKGYWLVAADGGVFAYHGAHYLGSLGSAGPVGRHVVAIAATPDAAGYWIVTSIGSVFAFGDAPYRGGSGERESATAAMAEATAVTTPPPSPYPAGSLGYDINWPQCSGTAQTSTVPLPGEPGHAAGATSYTVASVGVDGWAVEDPNPCLHAEVAWAEKAQHTGGASYNLYMLLNSPASTSDADATGPAGTCSGYKTGSMDWQRCLAYNYGWNAAAEAYAYAGSQGASSQVWWLDIENTSCSPSNFNGEGGAEPWSCDTALNDLTAQAAIDSLRREGITVGVYCTAYQWQAIMGDFVPEGPAIPLWIAGAPLTTPPYPQGWDGYDYAGESVLAPYCGSGYLFAGGRAWMLQETPGTNNYPYDPDYSCS